MCPGQMTDTAPDGHDTPHTADMTGRKGNVVALFSNLVGKQIKAVIMAAHTYNCIVYGRLGAQKLGCNRFVLGQTFLVIGNPDNSVCFRQRGNGSRTSWKRGCRHAPPHPSQLDAHKLFNTQPGGDFTGRHDIQGFPGKRRAASEFQQQGLNKLFKSDNGGNLVSWYSKDGRPVDIADDDRFSRHDRHPVDQQIPKRLNNTASIVFRTGRRSPQDKNHIVTIINGGPYRRRNGIGIIFQNIVAFECPAAGCHQAAEYE